MLRSTATSTAPSATEPDMKHETTRSFTPTPWAPAAGGVESPGRPKTAPNTFGVRLFKG
jgi:hypothetical protein